MFYPINELSCVISDVDLKIKVYSISAVNQVVFFFAYQFIDGGWAD